ncbi:uncharacterized protein LOC133722669 [Rosa rugosa]|uniref:uncharacterized protein LOC133722669 n=1 Tax=Rosa rugosa TaxID=74645 RepID=UPI002B414493|nr:uncharacterized protein LOC133722669 [Rosa rugosa]
MHEGDPFPIQDDPLQFNENAPLADNPELVADNQNLNLISDSDEDQMIDIEGEANVNQASSGIVKANSDSGNASGNESFAPALSTQLPSQDLSEDPMNQDISGPIFRSPRKRGRDSIEDSHAEPSHMHSPQ